MSVVFLTLELDSRAINKKIVCLVRGYGARATLLRRL